MAKKKKASVKKKPWNKGKSVGQKKPFAAEDVPIIRRILADHPRDLALFNVGIDTFLRGSDLLTLKVEDVTDRTGIVIEESATSQKKTREGVQFVLSKHSIEALTRLIADRKLRSNDYLFTSIRKDTGGQPLSTAQYRRRVKEWAKKAGLDERCYSGHSTRRSKAALIYEQTQNIAACQHLLGHKDIGSTARYLGVEKRDALNLARETEL